jgi:long-chain acyl-CoA synthetase
MISRSENVARGLYACGSRPGDTAAILASKSPAWTLTDAGCQFAGIIDVPIYTTLSPTSVEYIINDSRSKVLFIEDRAAYERVAEILAECDSIEKVIFFDIDGIDLPGSTSLLELEAAGRELKVENPRLLD